MVKLIQHVLKNRKTTPLKLKSAHCLPHSRNFYINATMHPREGCNATMHAQHVYSKHTSHTENMFTKQTMHFIKFQRNDWSSVCIFKCSVFFFRGKLFLMVFVCIFWNCVKHRHLYLLLFFVWNIMRCRRNTVPVGNLLFRL